LNRTFEVLKVYVGNAGGLVRDALNRTFEVLKDEAAEILRAYDNGFESHL